MNAVSMFAGFGVVGLLVLPADAQKSQGDRRVPVDVSVAGGGAQPLQLLCVQSILDQATGGCLQATSTPTNGMLFPYPGTNNTFSGTAFVGGGTNNTASRDFAAVGGGLSNTASGLYATVGGGSNNTAFGFAGTVGGGDSNLAPTYFATVAGGYHNTASRPGCTVAGGRDNYAAREYAAVGGGRSNTASGYLATVGGGRSNTGSGDYATVGGGLLNDASGPLGATVGGGAYNTASGYYATVSDGRYNAAAGNFSFTAGRQAMANHGGSFVWGDSQTGAVTKASSVADEFNVYCSGGARFFSNSAATTGVLLAPGGGSWTAVSDRAAKENVEPVDTHAVLAAVAEIPISTWNYREQSDSVRHMGPMAQDFYAAFGLGLGETTIDTIDPDGVALAAIQGLQTVVENQVAELKERLAEKDGEIVELRERLERLEAAFGE